MRKLKNENYRVMIEPRRLGDLGSVSLGDHYMCKDEADRQRQYRERCEQIVSEVKRHVAEVGYVSVVFDTVHVCEYCGSQWTEDDDKYNGGCCAKDQEAYDLRGATSAA